MNRVCQWVGHPWPSESISEFSLRIQLDNWLAGHHLYGCVYARLGESEWPMDKHLSLTGTSE